MTPHAPSRARRGFVEDLGALGAVGIALLLNVGLFTMIMGIALPAVRNPDTEGAMLPPREIAALDPSCDGDAILRAAAQAAVCLTPLTSDVDACLDQTQVRYESEVMLCHVDQMEALPQVALLDEQEKVQLEKIEPIDAEPLLEPLNPEEMKKFEKAIQEVLAPPPPPPPPAPPPPPRNQQVIEAPKPDKEEVSDDARFLAEYDSKVDKQSAKHENKWEEMVSKPQPEELTKKDQPKEANKPKPEEELDPGKQEDAPKVTGQLSMRKPGVNEPGQVTQEKRIAGVPYGSEEPAGDGKPKKGNGSVDQEEKNRVETKQVGEGGAGGGSQRAPNLRPDDETLERMVGGGSVDRTEDVEEGDENAFNTKRFVYASFFNRVKRVVAQNWDPVSVWHAEDPDGSHFGTKSRITVLRISLDAKGGVSKIVILQASGVDSLDDEAIRAFKAAQPFPNPPSALVGKNGLITFEFGFYFEIGERRTSWKYRRTS